MKKVLYLLLLCSVTVLSISKVQAQEETTPETSLFKVEDNAVIWQKVYSMNVTPKEYLTFIKLKGVLEDIDTLQSTIIGKLKRFKLNTYGAPWATTPIYLKQNMFTSDVRIEIKEDRYRVTLSNIKVVDGVNNLTPNAPGYLVDFETMYFKAFSKGKTPRPSFFKIDDPIITKNFDSFFTYKKSSSDF
ncbi:hypothetical protein [Emticicia sp. BO119]|uniref:hypothetical protein n=1 Tax=Emticicia sp. BO119 TaxID=2757768 RepID=UPI0015F11DD5|nr:hypothetical protein [Emticicia sp. BO119]MBA4851337.1 hypothetical protein [Emticicia sp. BO119]